MSSIQPGWYPDPQQSDRMRWWDGQQWTEHIEATTSQQSESYDQTRWGSPPDQPSWSSGPQQHAPQQGAQQHQPWGPGQQTGGGGSSSKAGWILGGVLVLVLILVVGGVIAALVFTGEDESTSSGGNGNGGGGGGNNGADLQPGGEAEGSVDDGGSTRLTLAIEDAGTYEISVVGSGWDPTLTVFDGSSEVGSDDDGGDGLNPLLTIDLEPGTYELEITPFGISFEGDGGDFTISVDEA